jgi:hypothetical protein
VDQIRTEIAIGTAPSAAAGALASYVCRRIAFHAGAFAPGIQDAVFDELHLPSFGATVADVHRWIGARGCVLRELGYRLEGRLVTAPIAEAIRWIERGRGYRGGVVSRDRGVVGLSVERSQPDADGELVLSDFTASGARHGAAGSRELAAWQSPDALELWWTGWA